MTAEQFDFLKGGGDMAEAIRRHDWASTPLGPIEHWTEALTTTVAIVVASRFPQALFWGPELIALYNDAFVPILGDKGDALGQPLSETWREVWDQVSPFVDAAFAGQAIYLEDFPLVVERGGRPERATFTFCYSPVRDRTGTVVGMLDTVTETTTNTTNAGRLAFLDDLSKALIQAEDGQAIMAITTRMVAQHLDLSNCAYADMDPDEDGFTIRGDWAAPGSPSIVGHYSLADFGVLAVENLSAGRPLVVNDNLRELAPEEAATFQSIGIAATICMPLVKAGRLTALMAIHDSQPRLWTDYELALINDVTERCWANIERVRDTAEARAAARALTDLNADLERRVMDEVAERTRAEDALRHSQKLDAIGQLTGGVAHDFNNLLTVIRSSADLLRRTDLPEERRQRYIAAIGETADRAAKLTSHLLAFSRRQSLAPKVFDVGARVDAVSDMLRSVLGARIDLEVAKAVPVFVEADPGEFETALLNMAVNASDAMDGEGRLGIDIVEIDALPPVRGHAGTKGAFVAVRVRDTGSGIAPENLDRVFEPFFTTKEVGRGTGLGLSQVFGFAKQSGGEVEVHSKPGEGAVFTLYLPRSDGAPEQAASSENAAPAPGQGRVLLVEDNIQIGEFATQLLRDLGYDTIFATSAQAALDTLAGPGRFDVVFSDVVMPGMNGVELGRCIRDRWPAIRILLTSGYSQALADDARHGFDLLRKPYSVQELSTALQRVMR